MLARALILIAFLFMVFWFISSKDEVPTESTDITSEEVLEISEDSEEVSVEDQSSAVEVQEGVQTTTSVVTAAPVVTRTYVPATVSEVKVYAYEWSLDFSEKEIKAGTVNFTVQNDGRFSHDFTIKGIGNLGKVAPGQTAVFTARLRAGTYEVYSDRREDYAKGMTDVITVVR